MSASTSFLIVGAGTMGGVNARLLANNRVPDGTLAGIVDIDIGRARELAAATNTQAFADIATAVAATHPTAAYVATPDALHRAPVETLARLGVAILVEKPLATTNEDAAAMLEAVTRAGVHAEVNYSNRWNPPFVAAMRSVTAGELGVVKSFNARLNNTIASPRDRLTWSRGTTPAWFLMSHCLDLAHWLGGQRAHSVYASGGRGQLSGIGIDTYDWIHALVRYDGGGDGMFESLWTLPESWPGNIEFNFRAVGTEGALDVDTTLQNIAVSSTRHRFPGTISWDAQRMTAFVRAMRGEAKSRVSFADGAEVTRILVAVHRSLHTGQVELV